MAIEHVEACTQRFKMVRSEADHLLDCGIRAKLLKRLPQSTEFSWRWLSTPKQNEVSCCCHGAGWWNEVSPGRHASAAWRATMNGWQPRWALSTSSPVLASCSQTCSEHSPQVNNRLYNNVQNRRKTGPEARPKVPKLGRSTRARTGSRRLSSGGCLLCGRHLADGFCRGPRDRSRRCRNTPA